MSNWDQISLYKFQQIDLIQSNKNINEIDGGLICTCIAFDFEFVQFDNMPKRSIAKYINEFNKIFQSPFIPTPAVKIGEYNINYHPEEMSFGQYIELSFYSASIIHNAHKILASISNIDGEANNADQHQIKSEFFLLQPAETAMGTVNEFFNRFNAFNERYKSLFGLDREDGSEIQSDPFNKRYGWIFSATRVAGHNRVTLDEAYRLPVIQAFNDLAYLKAKDKYDEKQLKKK